MKKVRFKKFLFENRYVLSAFLASAVILLITYIHLHIFPFGDRTILRVDLFHQYAPYLEEMRSRVANGQSLFYSWEGGLGKDFLAQTAYYTTSPLNLLYFWFPATALPEAVAIFIMIKVSLCRKERSEHPALRTSVRFFFLCDLLLLEYHVAGYDCPLPPRCSGA